MAKARSDLITAWVEINPETLSPQQRMAYNAMKQAKAAARDATQKFEAACRDIIGNPAGTKVVFGYNFGKLSVALAPDDAPKARAVTAKLSLADWLKSQGM